MLILGSVGKGSWPQDNNLVACNCILRVIFFFFGLPRSQINIISLGGITF